MSSTAVWMRETLGLLTLGLPRVFPMFQKCKFTISILSYSRKSVSLPSYLAPIIRVLTRLFFFFFKCFSQIALSLQECSLILAVIINYRAVYSPFSAEKPLTQSLSNTRYVPDNICLSQSWNNCLQQWLKTPFRKLQSLLDIHTRHLLINTRRLQVYWIRRYIAQVLQIAENLILFPFKI